MENGGVMKDVGKTGNAPIIKVGQTMSGVFGVEPLAMAKGVAGTKPMDESFK